MGAPTGVKGLPGLLTNDLPDSFGVMAVRYQVQLAGALLSLGVAGVALVALTALAPAGGLLANAAAAQQCLLSLSALSGRVGGVNWRSTGRDACRQWDCPRQRRRPASDYAQVSRPDRLLPPARNPGGRLVEWRLMPTRLGLAQISPHLGDVAANIALHLAAAEQAKKASVDLLVFPELSLTGYHLREQALEVGLHLQDDEAVLAPLAQASRTMDIVASFVEVDDRGRCYISAGYWSAGQLLHRHRKVYLPTYGLFDEGRYFAHGDKAQAFDTRFGRVGLLICEDFWHLSLPYLLWLDGAELLIMISASVEHGLPEMRVTTANRVNSMLQNYAGQLTTFVAHVNRTGMEDGLSYWGNATLFGPHGNLLAEGPVMKPDLLVADIDFADLRAARAALPLLRDERIHWTLRQLERIARNYG